MLLAIALLVAGVFLPYIPGDYDYAAARLSGIVQFAAFASLLLVPIGLAWCILDLVRRGKHQTTRHPVYARKAARVVAAVMILAAALAAFAYQSRYMAMLILGVGTYTLFTITRKRPEVRPIPSASLHARPYYFLIIPLAVVIIRLLFLEEAKNRSTDFVIVQCEALIEDIEAYHQTNGHYPVSLQSTIEDYRPAISGIPRFHYELSGQAYNIYFIQVSDMLGTKEVVMYNKLGAHEMTVHNQDLLRIPPERILRGYHEVAELPQPHWKIFYFD